MNRVLLLLVMCLLWSGNGFTQNNIQFQINHKLGDADFAMETGVKNNLDHDFEISRLEYYISEITIIHDGGNNTKIKNFWILVDAGESTQIDLGNEEINEVEAVHFYIGVDPVYNHLDPATYEASHPLAPQLPSMHWGWNAGYRFVALEGKGSSSFNQSIELHGLGDNNYFKTEIDYHTTAVNNEVLISLDADYIRALENIEVNAGVIVHGDDLEAKQCLENFKNFVFSPADNPTNTVDFSEVSKFDVFPNPTIDQATIVLETTQNLAYQVSVTDVLGREIMFFDEINSNSSIDIDLENTGLYFIHLIKEGQAVISKKLISK